MNLRTSIVLLLSFLFTACAVTWQEALQYGDVPEAFCDSVKTETYIGMMIVPVTIRGEEYRFLFDTGAPFSISQRVQQACSFEKLTASTIVDSDNNEGNIEYVRVDSLYIGHTAFNNQTAFVGDFYSNPKIRCLNIDGIIGSNLMRHCNWTIDYENQQLSFFNTLPDTAAVIKVPFRTNQQYDVLLELQMNEEKVKWVKLDYGFNGSLTIADEVYNHLLDSGVVDTFLLETGFSRSGIIGAEVTIEDKISPLDSLLLGEVLFENIVFSSSSLSLLGTKLLSQYCVSIDWTNRMLYFTPTSSLQTSYKSYLFGAGYDEDKGIYVQSLVSCASTDELGLQAGMSIRRINDLDFTKDTYCDYVELMDQNPDTLHLVIQNGTSLLPMTLTKEVLFP